MQDYGEPGGAGYDPYGGPQQQAPPPSAPPPPMPPPARRSKVPILVIVFALLAVIFMGISLALPWYVTSTEFAGAEAEVTYSFGGITADMGNDTETKGWDDKEIKDFYDNQAGVFRIAMIMTILGLIFAILLLVGAFMGMKGKGKKLAIIFGLLAFLFCLLAPIIFMGMHPGAVTQDFKDNTKLDPEGNGPHDSFIGEEEQDFFGAKIKATWGPGGGWILAILGFIFALLGFILALKLPRSATSAPLPPPAPTQPGYGAPPQQPPPQYPGY